MARVPSQPSRQQAAHQTATPAQPRKIPREPERFLPLSSACPISVSMSSHHHLIQQMVQVNLSDNFRRPSKQGRQLESPNTPFDGDQEFSQTTSGAGESLQSPSEVDSGSQEKRHSTINRELACPLS